LVAAEIGVAMVLLIGAALLTHSFLKLTHTPLGYEPENVLTFQIAGPKAIYNGPEPKRFAERFSAALRQLPGVQAVAYTQNLPMIQMGRVTPVSWGPTVVGPGAYFVAGDPAKLQYSPDSWGLVPQAQLLGVLQVGVIPK
jgi:hypothetical protein